MRLRCETLGLHNEIQYENKTFQNNILRCVVNAPWYVRNDDIHRDLKTPMVTDEVKRYAADDQQRLRKHRNYEVLQLLDNGGHVRRLQRQKPFELV